MVIDALRLDFVKAQAYSDIEGGCVEIMPRLCDLVTQLGSNGVLASFPADPPTTTMQRVKALLTGSLPTFLDVSSVFAGGEIREDNVLLQAMRSGMRVGAVGDDTWTQLFPPSSHASLNLSHPYPSLNVHDLDTVDDGVAAELRGGLLESDSWDVLVAHYLGVDHAGHTYSVGSPQMARKVAQMDAEISDVFERLVADAGPGQRHEHTVMLVFGDHGQTRTGDHGGGTPEEVDTPLLAVNLAAAAAARAPPAPPAPEVDVVAPTPLPPDLAAAAAAHAAVTPPTAEVMESSALDASLAAAAARAAPTEAALDAVDPSLLAANLAADAAAAAAGQQPPAEALHAAAARAPPAPSAPAPAPLAPAVPAPPVAMPQRAVATSGNLPVVHQLDFAASLSALLGLPLPFENVGKVHPQLWALAPEAPALPATTCACLPACIDSLSAPPENSIAACAACSPCLRTYATRISANADQVHTYLAAYAAAPLSSVSPASIASLTALMPPPASAAGGRAEPAPHTAAALAHLHAAAHVARTQWTHFNAPVAVAGLVVLALATALTAGALHAALFLRALHYTRLITSTRSFFALSCPPASSTALLPPPAMAMLALLAVRAAVPFSNSLVLAEAQVTQYLVVTGVLILTAAALSRAAIVCRSLSHAGHQLPPRSSPAVSAAVTLLSLAAAASRAAVPVPPPLSHSRRTENVEPADGDTPPRRARVTTLSVWGARVSFAVSRASIMKAARLTVALLCGVTLVTTSSWLLRNLCFLTIIMQLFFTQQRRVIGVAWSIGSVLLSLAKLPDPGWLLPSSMLILCNTLCCVHALWSPKATECTVWAPLGIDRGTSAVVHIALYGATACWSCMSLMRDGAIDRVGVSPFDKASVAEAPAGTRGSVDEGWWDGVVAQAAPALVCLALLSHYAHAAVQRCVAVPGTVRRFGTHVPWFKFFGDIVLLLHNALAPLGLMSDAQTLLLLLSLDNEDIEEQELEAHARHSAPDPAGDGGTQGLLDGSQRASRLRRRRMFLRGQPFFWQPHGQAYRRAGYRLLARAAAAHALLATLSLLFLMRACLTWRSAPGAPTLGEQSLEQLWRRALPREAPQWLQGILLLAVQQATALGFTFAYGMWRVPRMLVRSLLVVALGPVPGGVLPHIAARLPGAAPLVMALSSATAAVDATFTTVRTAPLALVTPRLTYAALAGLVVAAAAVARSAAAARTTWARCFMDSRLTEQAAVAPPSSFHSARGMAMEFGEGVWDLVRDFTADSNARALSATDALLMLTLACGGPLWLLLLPPRAGAIAAHTLVLVLCVLGVLQMHWWVELAFDRLVLFAAELFREQHPGRDIPFTHAPGASAFTGTLLACMLLCLLPHAAFLGSGHFCEFAGVQWPAAFVGFDSSDPPWRSGLLIAANTFLPHALVAALVVLVATREGHALMQFLDSAAAEGHVLQLPNRIPREQIHTAVQPPLGEPDAVPRPHSGSGPPLPLSTMRRRAASATPGAARARSDASRAGAAAGLASDDEAAFYSVDPSLPEGSDSIAEALELVRPGPAATLWDRVVLGWMHAHTRLVAWLSGLSYLEACNHATPPQTLSTTRSDVSLFDASRTPQQWASAELTHLVLLAALLLRLLAVSLDVLCASVSAWLQRRHLMVWALFAPKWLFEVCFWGVAAVSLVAAAAVADGCVDHLLPSVWRRTAGPESTLDRAIDNGGAAAAAGHQVDGR